MYILWGKVLLPLLAILAVCIVLSVIIFVFSITETMIEAKIQEWQIRRSVKKIIKDNCDHLRKEMTDMFDDIENAFKIGVEINDEDYEGDE